jgi:hypothetical protein
MWYYHLSLTTTYLPVVSCFLSVLGIEYKVLHILGKHSTIDLHPQPLSSCLLLR